MTTEATSDQIRDLADRADRAGYRLVRDPAQRESWQLLDAEDGTAVHLATSLEQVEKWLNE